MAAVLSVRPGGPGLRSPSTYDPPPTSNSTTTCPPRATLMVITNTNIEVASEFFDSNPPHPVLIYESLQLINPFGEEVARTSRAPRDAGDDVTDSCSIWRSLRQGRHLGDDLWHQQERQLLEAGAQTKTIEFDLWGGRDQGSALSGWHWPRI